MTSPVYVGENAAVYRHEVISVRGVETGRVQYVHH
jgi:hypothetical protein